MLLILLIVLQMFLEEPLAWLLGDSWQQQNPIAAYLLYEFLPACLQIFFTVLALYWILMDRRTDLVENRRSARWVLLLLVGVQGLLSLLVERIGFVGGFVAFPLMYPIHMLLVLLQILSFTVILYWLLRRDVFDFLAAPVTTPPVPVVDRSAEDVRKIVAALEEEKIYRQMGLTVADLARHLSIPEYRLRNLIQRELGYRNFNAFLHHYRIGEVAHALEDADQNATPILTLALSAGYQSINPFNRAFKALKGVTPSEYRGGIRSPCSGATAQPRDL